MVCAVVCMGINLSDLVVTEKHELEDFRGKTVAIDAFNTIYQFLSSIRSYDGSPLKDANGRPTSHLMGLLRRCAIFIELEIKPVFVFDGVPHELKSATIEDRRARKQKALEEWQSALEKGDMERARSKAQQTSYLSEDMVRQSQQLIDAFGIPHLTAPRDGEAQASHMAKCGDVDAAASQDYDALLFGAPTLIRNMTSSGRRKLPRQHRYITVEPELVELDGVLASLEIDHEQLVDLAILVGTDFNPGIKGIGPKTALKLIKKHGTLEAALDAREKSVENADAIRAIFLQPTVKSDYELEWHAPDEAAIHALLCDEFEFKDATVERSLERIRKSRERSQQQSLDQWA